jgi:rare lipoprotein A
MFASSGSRVDPRYNVSASPRVIGPGAPIPKGGGRAISSGKPYVIAGRVYRPRENPNYLAIGTASWYGDAFHGRRTANGEIFDKNAILAAHPTLPLPSYVRVTNLHNSRSMIIRVSDRGPFHGRRLIDLSQRAAELLGFKHAGTAQVKVEYMGRASLKGSDDRKLMSTLVGGQPQLASLTTSTSKGYSERIPVSSKSQHSQQFKDPSLRSESIPVLRSSIDPNAQAEMAVLMETISTERYTKKTTPQILARMLDEEPKRTSRRSSRHR